MKSSRSTENLWHAAKTSVENIHPDDTSTIRRCRSLRDDRFPADVPDRPTKNGRLSSPTASPWETIPAEILLQIFSKLDPLSIVSVAATCKRWRSIIADSRSLQKRKMSEFQLDDDDEFESMSVDADSDDDDNDENDGMSESTGEGG